MGFMDKFSNMFGGKEAEITEAVKPPSEVLRDNGIDSSGYKFAFNQDGSVGVSGQTGSQDECDRVCELIEAIPGVKAVQNNITVAAPEPEPAPAPTPEVEVAAEEVVTEDAVDADASTAEPASTGRTYTVQSGDTLWKIAQEMYGSGGKYMKIFEANTPLLDNPDKIRPGQELTIPDLDD